MALLVSMAICMAAAAQDAAPQNTAPEDRVSGPQKSADPPEMTLAAAVGLALRNNRAIKISQVAREAQKFAVLLQESLFTPQASLNSSVSAQKLNQKTYTKASQFSSAQKEISTLTDELNYAASVTPTATLLSPLGTSYTLQFNNGYTRSLDQKSGIQGPSQYAVDPELTIVQPLLQGFGRDVNTANLQISRLNERFGRLNMDNTVAQIITAVVSAYWQVVLTKEQLAIASHALDRARDMLEFNRALVASGRMAQLDMIQTEADIAQKEFSLDVADNAYKQSKTALLTLLALPKQIDFTPAGTGAIEKVDIPVGIAVDMAERNRIEIAQAKIARDLAKVSLLVAEDGTKWNLQLVGKAGSSNTRSAVMDAIRGVPSDSNAFSIGFQLVIPLTSLVPEAAVVSAKGNVQTAELTLEDTEATIKLATEDAVRNAVANYRQLQLADKARVLAEKQLAAERDKLSLGRSSNFQVLTYQDTLRTAQSNEVSARVGYLTSLANLDLAMGTTLDTWNVALTDMSADMTASSAQSMQRLATPPGVPGGALPPPLDRPNREPSDSP